MSTDTDGIAVTRLNAPTEPDHLEKRRVETREAAEHFWGGLSGEHLQGLVDDIWAERARQLGKWGVQERPTGASASRYKKLEDLARAEYEKHLAAGELNWVDILKEEFYEALAEEDLIKQRVELVQVMAVAASWVLDLDRRIIPQSKARGAGIDRIYGD